jgi:hypothetical protein
MTGAKDIIDAINSRLAILLPTHRPLDYNYLVEKNSFHANDDRYGSSVGEATKIDTVTCAFSITQRFNILLTSNYSSVDQDDKTLMTAILKLEDNMTTILSDLYKNKIGLPNLILQVNPIGIDSPLIIESSQLVILNGSIGIQYRYAI